jgi:hypothetical protein
MNRKARAFQPEATPLESKVMLSVAYTPISAAVEISGHIIHTGKSTPDASTATIKGRYFASEDNRAADAPLHVRLDAAGRVGGFGRVRMSGALDLGGFRIANTPDVSGTLTLSNGRGSLKINLTGSGGFNEVPNGKFTLNVSATSGTGAFSGFKRQGTVTIQFGDNQVRSIQAPSPIGGPMTVTFRFKPASR